MLFVIMRRLVSDNVKAEDVWLERLWVDLASVKSRCQPVNHTNSNDVLLLQIQCSSCTHTHTLHFNGHFPGEPGLAGFIGANGDEIMGTTAAIRCGKLWSNRHQLQTNTQLFTGRMPFLSPNKQHHKALKGKISHFMDLLTQSSPAVLPTFSVTIKGSWLPWGGLPCLLSALWRKYPNTYTHTLPVLIQPGCFSTDIIG